MPVLRMVCKECSEDMIEISTALLGTTFLYFEYECPGCGQIIGVEVEDEDDEREDAVWEREDSWP